MPKKFNIYQKKLNIWQKSNSTLGKKFKHLPKNSNVCQKTQTFAKKFKHLPKEINICQKFFQYLLPKKIKNNYHHWQEGISIR